jgi:hypothetical protein
MRNKSICFLVILADILVITSCASMGVYMQGKDYFFGKREADVIKYFGYDGQPVDCDTEYDKAVYFTDKMITYTAKKAIVQRYKVSNSNNVFIYTYSEYNDGCLLERGLHFTSAVTDVVHGRGVQVTSPVIHRNDNAVVRSYINRFNSEVKRLNCIAPEYRQEYFDKSKIGDRFFVSRINQKYSGPSWWVDENNNTYSETFVIYTLLIEQIDVVADDRTEIDSRIAATYSERADSFYDEDGKAISEERAQFVCDWYKEKGFEIVETVTGFSMTVYIKDGKVIKAE